MPAHPLGRAAIEQRLLACVHCGLCLPVCPTYRAVGDENDSPRGRVRLMRAVAQGQLGSGGAFALHISRCLGCRACETACPAGVEFGALLEAAREELAATHPARGRAARRLARLILWCVTGGRRSRVLFAAARVLRGTALVRGAARLRGRAGLAARMLLASAPMPVSSGARAPPHDDRSAPSFALLEGCVMRGLFGHVHAATRRALRASGYVEAAAPGQRCCGALHAHAGDAAGARALARANVDAFDRSGARWIAVNSAGCGAALREYPRWLKGVPGLEQRTQRLAARVRDVSELLAAPPRPVRGRLRGRAGYDASCHLLHGQQVRREPLEMLRRIDGLDVAKLPSHDRCCGGAGVYNLLQPDLATRVLEPKIDDVRAGAYDWVVTGNPGCLMQIGAGLRDAEIAVPVLHPVELLDLALTPASGRVAEEGGRPARAEARSGGAGRLPDAPAAESMRNGR